MTLNSKELLIKLDKEKFIALYALWRSSALRLGDKPSMEILEKYDLLDVDLEGLRSCHTKTRFAEKFGVSRKRLCNLDKKEKTEKIITDFDKEGPYAKFQKMWNKALRKFSKKVIRNPTPKNVKLWKIVFGGWKPPK